MIVRVVRSCCVTAVFECYPPRPLIYVAVEAPCVNRQMTSGGTAWAYRRWLTSPDHGLSAYVGAAAAESFRQRLLAAVAEIEAALTAPNPRQE